MRFLIVLSCLYCHSIATAAELSGGFVFSNQASSDDRVKSDVTASVDLGITWRQNGRWWLSIEGNTTPKQNSVATLLPESNADADTALDSDREGRLQISEINYQYSIERNSSLTIGLLDASSYMDVSRISNDENTQFIGVSFVNNPTIEFPDYALGLVYQFRHHESKTVTRLIVTSSNGLSDNPNASYSQLVDVDNPDKGAFIAARIGYESTQRLAGFGIWTHTAPHESLDSNGNNGNGKNYGAYFVSGWRGDKYGLNARLGIANARVSNANWYGALTNQYRFKPWILGAGMATIFLSNHAEQTDRGDTFQTEIYLRNELRRGIFLTGSIQYLVNSNFDASDSIYDSEIFVGSLRVSYVFE